MGRVGLGHPTYWICSCYTLRKAIIYNSETYSNISTKNFLHQVKLSHDL